MVGEKNSKGVDKTRQGNGNMIIFLCFIALIVFAGLTEAITIYSTMNANKVCMSKGYKEAVESNLNSVYCVKWVNISIAGINSEFRQDDIYININGNWTLYKSYHHGIGEIHRNELMN